MLSLFLVPLNLSPSPRPGRAGLMGLKKHLLHKDPLWDSNLSKAMLSGCHQPCPFYSVTHCFSVIPSKISSYTWAWSWHCYQTRHKYLVFPGVLIPELNPFDLYFFSLFTEMLKLQLFISELKTFLDFTWNKSNFKKEKLDSMTAKMTDKYAVL